MDKTPYTSEDAMSECTKNSDRECCYTCNKRYYDMNKGEYCRITGRSVKAWNDCDCDRHEWQLTAGE